MPSKKPSPPAASSSSSSDSDDTQEMTSAKRGTGSRSSKAPPPSGSSSSTSSGSDLRAGAKRSDVPTSPVVHTPSKKGKLAAGGKGSSTAKPQAVPSAPLVHTPSKKRKATTGVDGNGPPAAKNRGLPSSPSVRTPLEKGTATVGDVENGPSSKKIRRVWTEERVNHLLNGSVEYVRSGGSLSNKDAFIGFVRSSLNMDVTKGQLFDKLHKLRALYRRNAEKGESLVFDSVYEENAYKASKQIWGDLQTERKDDEDEANAVADGKEDDPLPSKEKEAQVNGVEEENFKWLFVGQESVYENLVRHHISSIEPSVLEDLVEKETKLREKMMKMRLKQLAYEQELINVILTRKGSS